jgi:plastocyanin
MSNAPINPELPKFDYVQQKGLSDYLKSKHAIIIAAVLLILIAVGVIFAVFSSGGSSQNPIGYKKVTTILPGSVTSSTAPIGSNSTTTVPTSTTTAPNTTSPKSTSTTAAQSTSSTTQGAPSSSSTTSSSVPPSSIPIAEVLTVYINPNSTKDGYVFSPDAVSAPNGSSIAFLNQTSNNVVVVVGSASFSVPSGGSHSISPSPGTYQMSIQGTNTTGTITIS